MRARPCAACAGASEKDLENTDLVCSTRYSCCMLKVGRAGGLLKGFRTSCFDVTNVQHDRFCRQDHFFGSRLGVLSEAL